MKEAKENKYKVSQNSAFLDFLMEIINYLALSVNLIIAFSISLLMDMLASTCNFIRTGICFFLNKKLQKNLKYSYNYGAERLEVLVTTFCDILMVLSSIFIFGFAVYSLFVPRGVSDLVLVAVIFKVLCVLADLGVVIVSAKDYKKVKTQSLKSTYEGALSSLAFDCGILLAVLLSMILKNWVGVGYIEPIISIVIAVVIIVRAIKRVKNNIKDLSDLTLDEESQMKILKIVNSHYDEFLNLKSINSHKLGNKIIVDFDFEFDPETTYKKLEDLVGTISKEIEQQFADCSVSLHITKSNN